MGWPSSKLLALLVDARASDFPDACVGRDIHGVDLMALHTLTCGMVTVFVGNGCALDVRRARMLRTAVAELANVIPSLDLEARLHFEKLRALAQQALVDLYGAQ